jgi:hypothetical protein
LKHYFDTVANQSNVLVPNASVTVYLAGTTTKASIFSDDGVTLSANPVFTDVKGVFSFYVADGKYDLLVSGPDIATLTVHNVEIADITEAGPGTGDAPWETDLLTFVNQTTGPPVPPAGVIDLYTLESTKHIYIQDDAGNVTDLASGGGGGGGVPGNPANSLQFNNGGSFGGAQFIYNGNDTSELVCEGPCADVIVRQDSGLGLFATDGVNGITLAASSNSNGGANFSTVAQTTTKQLAAATESVTLVGGTNNANAFPGSTGPIAIGYSGGYGDIVGDPTTGQDVVGFYAQPLFNRTSGVNLHWAAGYVVTPPVNTSGSVGIPATENTTNTYGLVVQDQLGLSTVDTAAVLILPQTAPASGTLYAIEAQTGSGVSLFADGITGNSTSTVGALKVPAANILPGSSSQILTTVGGVASWQAPVGSGPVTLYSSATSVTANAGVTTPQTLMSYTAPAGQFNVTGRTVRVTGWGTIPSTAISGTATILFNMGGANPGYSVTIPLGSSQNWYWKASLLMYVASSGTSEFVSGFWETEALNNSTGVLYRGMTGGEPGGFNLTNPFTISGVVTFSAGNTANSATQFFMLVEQLI